MDTNKDGNLPDEFLELVRQMDRSKTSVLRSRILLASTYRKHWTSCETHGIDEHRRREPCDHMERMESVGGAGAGEGTGAARGRQYVEYHRWHEINFAVRHCLILTATSTSKTTMASTRRS